MHGRHILDPGEGQDIFRSCPTKSSQVKPPSGKILKGLSKAKPNQAKLKPERSPSRGKANAKPQPTAVEIQQAPTFTVVDGQVVQPAGLVQPAAVSVQVDTNGDGVTDTVMTDTNNDGQFDSAVPMGVALK